MAEVRLGKKGIFMTFIAISIIMALMLIFVPSDLSLKKNLQSVNNRVVIINTYVDDFEKVYLERSLYLSGVKTITALIMYMENDTGKPKDFLTNFEDSFQQVLLNRTIGTNEKSIGDFIGEDIMTNNTYPALINKSINVADDVFNVETNYTIHGIKVGQTGPWFVDVEANISFYVKSESAKWEKNYTIIRTQININKFHDPYYSLKTGGLYINTINKSEVPYDEWRLENLTNHTRHGEYYHWDSSDAPSFIMRFTDDISPSSCCGIESVVNPAKLADLGFPSDIALSYADYMFFESWSISAPYAPSPVCADVTDTLFNINGIETGTDPRIADVKLDYDHLVKFNCLAEAEQVCPPE
jgi:hypothetical protein